MFVYRGHSFHIKWHWRRDLSVTLQGSRTEVHRYFSSKPHPSVLWNFEDSATSCGYDSVCKPWQCMQIRVPILLVVDEGGGQWVSMYLLNEDHLAMGHWVLLGTVCDFQKVYPTFSAIKLEEVRSSGLPKRFSQFGKASRGFTQKITMKHFLWSLNDELSTVWRFVVLGVQWGGLLECCKEWSRQVAGCKC